MGPRDAVFVIVLICVGGNCSLPVAVDPHPFRKMWRGVCEMHRHHQ